MSQSKQGMCQDLLKTFEEEEKDKMIQGMCLLFHIGETTKICRKIKEKMKVFKIEGKTTKVYS